MTGYLVGSFLLLPYLVGDAIHQLVMTGLLVVGFVVVLLHGWSEWQGRLATWSFARFGARPFPWLDRALPIAAIFWNGAPLLVAVFLPEARVLLAGFAAGGLLSDAVATHALGRWKFGAWPPGSATVPAYLVVAVALLWVFPGAAGFSCFGSLVFIPYWLAVRACSQWR